MKYSVDIIKEGYSYHEGKYMKANGTCTLIRGGGINVIVDTLSAWDRDFLEESLSKRGLRCADVNFVVCTHGHSDHIGNLNLFQAATHIVGRCVCKGDAYQVDAFEKDNPFCIAEDLHVVLTPGHTLSDVSVFVATRDLGTVAITGDLFEKAEDLEDPSLWKEVAGSEDPTLQAKNRQMVLEAASHIVPGHGPMFPVTAAMRQKHLALLR